ncbi:ABC transporter ATP-binding protein/permease [Bacteriovoracales bacterium]|nr:ABC transporter ATP-binding protein/permease [Bacteriovoracales bacterium]
MNLRLNEGIGKVLTQQFRNFWPYYIGALIMLYFTHSISSELPFMAKELADLVSEKGGATPTSTFFWVALGIITFRTSSRLLFFYPARVFEKNMRMDILKRIENCPPQRYRNYSSGQLFQVLYTDIEQMRAFVGFALLQVGNITFALLVLIPKIYQYSSDLVWAIIPMFVSSALFTFFVGKTRHHHRKALDYQGDVQNFIMEVYEGKKTIKNYHAEKSFLGLFKEKSFKELYSSYKAGVAISFSVPLVPFGVGISFIWGAYIIFSQGLGATSLVLFSGFAFLFLEPLHFISWIGIVFVSSFAAWGRIGELIRDLEKESEEEKFLIEQNESGQTEGRPWKKGFFSVNFWEERLSFNVETHQWTALIGNTGCGKSVVLFQLAHVLRNKGEKISLVAQGPYIYNDSLESNIFLGKTASESQKDEAYELLKLFSLDFLSSDRDSLLALEVGEHGKRLSGGQAKRLCLVRSLLGGADWFIWDDPFSSIDVLLEKEIVEKLKALPKLKKKTFILSTHRASTVRFCQDLIFFEKKVGIVEKGETEDLLGLGSKSKTYEYFEKQLI